jgi:hypothetical protein
LYISTILVSLSASQPIAQEAAKTDTTADGSNLTRSGTNGTAD